MINTPSFFKISLLALSCGASAFSYANELHLKQGGAVDASEQAAAMVAQRSAEQVSAPGTFTQTEKVAALDDSHYLILDSQPLVPAAVKNLQQPSVKVPLKTSQQRVSLSAETAAITPVCPTLNIDTLYTLNNSTAGSASCYHFEITQRAKTTVLVVGQNAQTNANLTVFRHEADDSLTVVGSSANAGNADEVVLALTEPGHYYWYIDLVAADGGAFNFAAVANTSADSYELNDSLALSTPLGDKLNNISGNMDSTADVDYYHFTALRGQDTSISLGDSFGNNEWILELYNGGWQVLGNNLTHNLSGLQANQVVNVRVTPNPALSVDPSHNYQLSFGSKPAIFSDYSVDGESNVTRVTYGATSTYLTTQAYKNLTWGATIKDSSGQPIEGAQVKLRVDKSFADNPDGYVHYVDYTLTTDSSGQVAGNVTLGTCSGSSTSQPHYEYKFGTKNWWQTEFNYGGWRIEVPGNADLGVGGNSVPYVVLGHLCKQTYLGSE
ncbi:hypothetical protein [Thalassomonas haliotis]|uniref:Peptidase C-terminal archaeal/bacterial domain-containing protein n=1 Tax=Thalassomonas haliotis TaxID=485448 RepID=A0ABY7VGU4_9GAMM|nr:hypothetical protein [Thalassomonas haliotis]WDE12748.1 hypothetical protein H3N35_04560 [Thalassomonas haliotis]